MRTLAGLRRWAESAPVGTTVLVSSLIELLDQLEPEAAPVESAPAPETWRERLWTVPPETRLGVLEVAEALGRPRSYVYARTGSKAEDPIPHRKLDGTLIFVAGELRAWIQEREEVVAAGPMESTGRGRLGVA